MTIKNKLWYGAATAVLIGGGVLIGMGIGSFRSTNPTSSILPPGATPNNPFMVGTLPSNGVTNQVVAFLYTTTPNTTSLQCQLADGSPGSVTPTGPTMPSPYGSWQKYVFTVSQNANTNFKILVYHDGTNFYGAESDAIVPGAKNNIISCGMFSTGADKATVIVADQGAFQP